MIDSYIYFFFNYTATTEIYTYLHTLSLHDALPIFQRYVDSTASKLDFFIDSSTSHIVRICTADDCKFSWTQPSYSDLRLFTGLANRSEEHTSELQSLMRISYAVFCLTKKQIIYTITYTTTSLHIITEQHINY